MCLSKLDYGARWYDAAVGRFTTVDPLAEKYLSWSPYNYVLNKPISFVDPSGRYVVDPSLTSSSKILSTYLSNSLKDYVKFIRIA